MDFCNGRTWARRIAKYVVAIGLACGLSLSGQPVEAASVLPYFAYDTVSGIVSFKDATNHNVAICTDVAGSCTYAGLWGLVHSTGPSAGFQFDDRASTGSGWLFYSQSGIGALYDLTNSKNAFAITPGTEDITLTGNIASSHISFAQPVTGATWITVQAHNNNVYNMTDFMTGGQPDGTTDNSADFAKLNNLCTLTNSGGTVYLQALTYKVHDVTFNCGIVLQGTRGGQAIPASSPVRPTGGTVLDYSSASNFAIKWMNASWPNVTTAGWINAPGIFGVDMYTTVQTSSIFALRFYGVMNPMVENVDFNGENGSLIEYYGGFGGAFTDIHAPWMNGIGILLRGDTAGRSLAGGACTLDCSSRIDVPYVARVNIVATSTSTACYEIRGLVSTAWMEHTTCENGVKNLLVDCPAGFPNMSYCPQFGRIYDSEGEGQSYTSFDLSDFTDFRLIAPYGVGTTATTNNNLSAKLVNYTASAGTGGGLYISNPTFYNAGGSCVDIEVNDTKITGGFIQYCNFGNVGGVGILINKGNQHVIDGVTFCTYLTGYSATHPMGAIYLAAAADQIIIANNTYYNCSAPAVSNNAAHTAISNNLGP